MSPDLDTYLAAAKAVGDAHAYRDADLLRLWAALDALIAGAMLETCPQVSRTGTGDNPTETPPSAVNSSQHKKESP